MGLHSRLLSASTEAIDVDSRQTRRAFEERGRKTFCIITTFRKEHALKGNIFSKPLGCLLYRDYLVSLTPHALKKLVAKRLAFLIVLNYPDMVFCPCPPSTTDARETVSETNVSDGLQRSPGILASCFASFISTLSFEQVLPSCHL